MKNLLFAAAIFAAVLLFNTNSYSQSSCCKEGAACCTAGSSCCADSKTSSSGDAQAEVSDSLKSDSHDVKKETEVKTEVKTEVSEKSVCPVSGEEFKTGAGKKINYLGKQYEFCCGGCVEEFKAEPIGYTGGTATCPICNHDDGNKEIHTTHDGVKYYFCNEGCKKEFSENPDKTLEKYNTTK